MVRINGMNALDDGASFTGTPTIAEIATFDSVLVDDDGQILLEDGDLLGQENELLLANRAVNSAAYVSAVSGITVPVGKGIEFTASGGSANTTSTIRATCSTDSSPAETLVYDLYLDWE